MGIFDEFKRLAHPFEDPDDEPYDEGEDFDVSPRPVERRERSRSETSYGSRETSYGSRETAYGSRIQEDESRGNKVVNIRAATQLQVVLVKPEKFEDASTIADHLREKRTVVLNVESTNKDIARRLLDFLSGVAYANEGKISLACRPGWHLGDIRLAKQLARNSPEPGPKHLSPGDEEGAE